MIQAYDHILTQLERDIITCAKEHDLRSYALLQTIPGVGRILALVILYVKVGKSGGRWFKRNL